MVGLFRAHADGDDVVVLDDAGAHERARFPMLRQQQQKSAPGAGSTALPHVCLADFVAPKASGVPFVKDR